MYGYANVGAWVWQGCHTLLYLLEYLHVLGVGDDASAHRLEVRCLYLAVDHQSAVLLHELGEEDKRELACAGHEREHALADEAASERHAVESAHESVALPHLHALRKVLAVELGVGVYYILAKPRSFRVVASVGFLAATYHAVEVVTDRHVVLALVNQRAHRVRHVYLFGEDDKALLRTVPQRLVVVAEREPRKDAVTVCEQQAVDGEVAANAQESVGLHVYGLGEYQFFANPVNHDLKYYSGLFARILTTLLNSSIIS